MGLVLTAGTASAHHLMDGKIPSTFAERILSGAIYGPEPTPLATYLAGLVAVQTVLAVCVAFLTRAIWTLSGIAPRLAGAQFVGWDSPYWSLKSSQPPKSSITECMQQERGGASWRPLFLSFGQQVAEVQVSYCAA